MPEPSPQVAQAVQASGITRLTTPPTVMDPGPPTGLSPKKWVEPINDPPVKTGKGPHRPTTWERGVLSPGLQVPVPVSGKPGATSGPVVPSSVGVSAKSPVKDNDPDLIDVQEQKEDGEALSGMPGEERVPKEIVERFGRVEFHGTAMVAILSQGFGFQVSRLEPAQQLLLRGRITEAFTRLLNDPNTLGRVFNRIKFLCQSIWSDRKIGNIIAGMVVSAGLSAYLKDGLLED